MPVPLFVFPLLMTIIGLVWCKHPPEDITPSYGYRSKRAMKNGLTWEFAHKTCGKVWALAGPALLVNSTILFFLARHTGKDTVFVAGLLAIVAAVVLTFLVVEAALKKHFDTDGYPKKR